MRKLALLTLAALFFVAVAAAPAPRSSDDVFYCGGETTSTVVASYFEGLDKALAETAPRSRFNQFVADRFGVSDSGGRTLWFALEDFESITPGRIGIDEWRHINDRGQASLEDAGWRGCFMDHGKVWFEADGKSGLKLRSINRNMDWIDVQE